MLERLQKEVEQLFTALLQKKQELDTIREEVDNLCKQAQDRVLV